MCYRPMICDVNGLMIDELRENNSLDHVHLDVVNRLSGWLFYFINNSDVFKVFVFNNEQDLDMFRSYS